MIEKKQEDKKAINFKINKNTAKLINAFVMKNDTTIAALIESLINDYITEHKEEARKLIQAYDLEMDI